jgi:hypothetical protein
VNLGFKAELLVHFKLSSLSAFSVFYGCETWSLALREEHSSSMIVNRVWRRNGTT